MTELKKLTTLCQEIEVLAKSLLPLDDETNNNQTSQDSAPSSAHQDLRVLQKNAQEYLKLSQNLRERTDKILIRARETDPDKQTYNEATCVKIEALGVDVDRVLTTIVTEDRLDEIERNFLSLLRREAQDRAQREETAKTVDALIAEEADTRMIFLVDDEKVSRGAMMDLERRDKTDVYRVEGERAQAIWRIEQDRRKKEFDAAKENSNSLLASDSSAAKVKDFVVTRFFKEKILDKIRNLQHQDKERKNLECAFHFILNKLSEILHALLGDPEQEGLRTMRTDAERFVKTFGHPYLFFQDNNNNNKTNNGNKIQVRRSLLDKCCAEAAEFLLSGVGYAPTYTASRMLDGHWIESGKTFVNDVMMFVLPMKENERAKFVKRSDPNMGMPECCFFFPKNNAEKEMLKNKIEVIQDDDDDDLTAVVVPPWFEYGDRRLSLQEPSVIDNAEMWMQWHENLKLVTKCLDEFCLKIFWKEVGKI